jgi:hypothetical protein
MFGISGLKEVAPAQQQHHDEDEDELEWPSNSSSQRANIRIDSEHISSSESR